MTAVLLKDPLPSSPVLKGGERALEEFSFFLVTAQRWQDTDTCQGQ
jgi:hypothetical protein